MTNLTLLDIIHLITDENDITTVEELCGFLSENKDLKVSFRG